MPKSGWKTSSGRLISAPECSPAGFDSRESVWDVAVNGCVREQYYVSAATWLFPALCRLRRHPMHIAVSCRERQRFRLRSGRCANPQGRRSLGGPDHAKERNTEISSGPRDSPQDRKALFWDRGCRVSRARGSRRTRPQGRRDGIFARPARRDVGSQRIQGNLRSRRARRPEPGS
jgi:hypothetical protein